MLPAAGNPAFRPGLDRSKIVAIPLWPPDGALPPRIWGTCGAGTSRVRLSWPAGLRAVELRPELTREPLDRPRRVLLVEPSASEASRLRDELTGGQIEVFEAADRVAAMEALPIVRPDLILSQMHLPLESGLELLRCLKHQGESSAIPVILQGHGTTPEERVRAFDLGAFDVLASR
jgi:PleD family two-component response regulator